MIKRWYEVTCDYCGCGEHYTGSKRDAWNQAKENGWRMKRGKHWDGCEAANRTEPPEQGEA